MLVLSLNVDNGGVNVRTPTLAWVDQEQPDVVTLQELMRGSAPEWRSELVHRRYHVVDTFEFDERYKVSTSEPMRKHGLLIASRWSINALNSRRLRIQ